MKKKIILLGPNGMLGQMVLSFFQKFEYTIIPIHERYSYENREKFITEIKSAGEGYVINCIGKIKQKTSFANDLYFVNSILPLDLINGLLPNQFLIHPSTDCVFDGLLGFPYSVDTPPNAKDDYGWSKRLGEVALLGKKNSLILRVSIVGPDKNINPQGLLGWFLSQKSGSTINGFCNHFWNGVTTLEWCRLVKEMIESEDLSHNSGQLIQIASPDSYSKYDMLILFNTIYKKDIEVKPYYTEVSIDRRLIGNVISKSLKDQIMELYYFNRT